MCGTGCTFGRTRWISSSWGRVELGVASLSPELFLPIGDLLTDMGLLLIDLFDDLLFRRVVEVIENHRAGVFTGALLLESLFNPAGVEAIEIVVFQRQRDAMVASGSFGWPMASSNRYDVTEH